MQTVQKVRRQPEMDNIYGKTQSYTKKQQKSDCKVAKLVLWIEKSYNLC